MDAGPQRLGDCLTTLIALRGLARKQADAQLQTAWVAAAGPKWTGKTRAVSIRRGVLYVAVSHSPLLSELVSFHRKALLKRINESHPHLQIRDLKFRLDGDLRPSENGNG